MIRRKQANIVLKILIFLVLIGALYYQVSYGKDILLLRDEFLNSFEKADIFLFIAVLLLSFANWMVETLKWKILLAKVSPIGFLRAFRSVYCGLAFSIFTPNRIGEYAGRILFLPHRHRIQGIIIAIVSSISQIIITLGIGALSLSFLIGKLSAISDFQFWLLFSISLAFTFFLAFIYYNQPLLLNLKWPRFLSGIKRKMSIVRKLKRKELSLVMFLSFSRYIIYTVQYLLLLEMFNVYIALKEGIMAIPVIFLIQTAIPVPAVMEAGLRGNIAGHVLGVFSGHGTGIISAALSLWLINLILPAALGGIFIFKSKIIKE